jgi:hypothetical protein
VLGGKWLTSRVKGPTSPQVVAVGSRDELTEDGLHFVQVELANGATWPLVEDETEVLKVVGVIDSSTTCTTLVTTREDDDWEGVAEDDSTDDEIKADSLGAAVGLIETPGTFEAVDGSGSEETALDCFDVVV